MSGEQLPLQGQSPQQEEMLEPGQAPNVQAPTEPGSRFNGVLRDIVSGSALISVLAVVLAMVAGAVLIALTDQNVHAASGYFFSRPTDTLSAIWQAVSGAYISLFQGSIYNFTGPTLPTASGH